MSKPIRFRVWNTKLNQYFIQNKNNRLDLALEYFELTRHVKYPEEYIGINDRNDNEIFVGDFISHNNNVFEVVFSETKKVIVLRANDSKLPSTNWRDLEWCYNVRNYIEIVGNINETPNLLNKNDNK